MILTRSALACIAGVSKGERREESRASAKRGEREGEGKGIGPRNSPRFPLPSRHLDLLCISKEGYSELDDREIGVAREARGTRTGGKRHSLLGSTVLEANF